jgi:hypothetical protein
MKELASIESMPLETLRDQVLDGLVQRYSQEGLGMEDFERRTSLATKALTKAELLTAVEGLPEAGPAYPSPAPRASSSPSTWKYDENPKARQDAIAIFGAFERKGVWKAPRRMESLCVFGGAEIDLRKAIVPREGVTISVLAVFGGLDITIPPDMRVEVAGMGVFGGFDHKATEADDSAPLVRIEGLAIFGGVGIKIRS